MKKNLTINEKRLEYDFERNSPTSVSINYEGKTETFELISYQDQVMIISNGKKQFKIHPSDNGHYVFHGFDFWLEDDQGKRKSKASAVEGQMLSPMPGKILKVMVGVGQSVSKGDPLLIMEAMKMEHTIKATKDGVVAKLDFKEGDQVAGGIELVGLE